MNKALVICTFLFFLILPVQATVFNIAWVDQGINPICSISLTPEEGDKEKDAVKIYEDVDGLKKISAALGKFTEWHFKSIADKLGPVSKQVDDIKGFPFRGGAGGHLTITFNRLGDGTNTCVFVIANGTEGTEVAPAYKSFLKKAWIDNLIKEATDPDRIAKAKKAADDLN